MGVKMIFVCVAQWVEPFWADRPAYFVCGEPAPPMFGSWGVATHERITII